MAYGTEPGVWNEEATAKRIAPVDRQMQELEMQGDRLEKMVAVISERVGPILTPDHPRDAKAESELDDSDGMSSLARKLQMQAVRFSQLSRRLEDLNSRMEL